MKRLLIIITVIGLISFVSCKKDETKTTINSTFGTPVLTIPGGSNIVFQKASKDSLITYTWTAAQFGAQVVVSYNVQMDLKGNNFKNAVSLGVVINALSLTIKVNDVNSKLLPLELDPKKPDPLPVEFRVQATINPNVDPANSVTSSQSITPYYVPIIYPLLFVPGNYQGWNAGDSNTAIASLTSNSKYEGYIWFGGNSTQFKYDKGGTWDVNWGDNGADGTLDPGGANIVAGPAGYYKLNVDLIALTHTFLRTAWSVIGDATPGGWNTDTDMAYDSIAKVWTVTLDLTAANIKFRANHAWDLNYGDTKGNGSLDAGGSNIPVTVAGNYTITMNLSQPVYKYRLVKN